MKRFLVAAVLALVVASQADAQLIRRYRPAYYSNYSYSPYVYGSPSSGVVQAGYATTPTYSYYPAWSDYTYPTWSGSTYPTWSGSNAYWNSGNGYTRYGGWRRGWRW